MPSNVCMDIDLSTKQEISYRFHQLCACFAILVRNQTEPVDGYIELFYVANALKDKFCPEESAEVSDNAE